MPDPYLIPGTVVLQNKLGISDFDELEQAVADAMAYRLFDKNTPVPPTLAGWRAAHKACSAQCSSGPAISAMSIYGSPAMMILRMVSLRLPGGLWPMDRERFATLRTLCVASRPRKSV